MVTLRRPGLVLTRLYALCFAFYYQYFLNRTQWHQPGSVCHRSFRSGDVPGIFTGQCKRVKLHRTALSVVKRCFGHHVLCTYCCMLAVLAHAGVNGLSRGGGLLSVWGFQA